ncbi:protein PSK SIMULATOR 2 [Sesamum angolense]|uniref:Protein PSK SIMULATOR 2 n=1 Tax=Sesamum angolense TaxID=2727404 RepID=A0AAE2BJ87_9LAMI|nr:protein PSK SIMULATOR 2 [Sesamum angolense]
MGAVCSGGTLKKSRKADEVGYEKSSGFSGKLKSMGSFGKHKNHDDSYSYPAEIDVFEKAPHELYNSGELRFSISQELKPSTPARIPANKMFVNELWNSCPSYEQEGRHCWVREGSGSSGHSWQQHDKFELRWIYDRRASRGNKISILAFEVANTIAKGANLLQSLSEENIQFLKKEILHSEGVRRLVSTDMNDLLSIAAADKREEFDVFSREVIRFGNMCKDPQWHNLHRFFSKLDSDPEVHKQQRDEAELTMHELTTLAQHTSELYHELHALDRFEQDYQRMLAEVDSLHLPRKGESLTMLQNELKHQRKLVRSLKKKSLWSKSLEQVMENLVDVVTFIHQEISEAFGDNGWPATGKFPVDKPERLGVAGLALHYANIISQIDNITSRPTSLPPNMRDTLYNGLPPTVKAALRSRLQTVDAREELTSPQIKAEMEKTLKWLVPLALDTINNEFGKKTSTPNNVIRLQNLYHADKRKADACILELVTWLHRLISLVRYRDNGLKVLPFRSPTTKGLNFNIESLSNSNNKIHKAQLNLEDKNLLEEVIKRRKLVPGLSKSQELVMGKRKKVWVSRSAGGSPRGGLAHPKANVLDILDGLDTSFSAPPWEDSR